MAYHRDAATSLHYSRFTIPKRDGTERPIWAPKKKLKAAQRWILHNIVERLPVHGAAQGFMVGRSTLTNAAVHANPKTLLKMDVTDFFPTVTWRRVKGVFRRAGYRDGASTLLALLCTEAPREVVQLEGKTYFVSLGPRCLPQGAPTSPAITNALCLRLDRRLAGLAAKLGWRYSRYADDMTFSLPADHKGKPRLGGAARVRGPRGEGRRVRGERREDAGAPHRRAAERDGVGRERGRDATFAAEVAARAAGRDPQPEEREATERGASRSRG